MTKQEKQREKDKAVLFGHFVHDELSFHDLKNGDEQLYSHNFSGQIKTMREWYEECERTNVI